MTTKQHLFIVHPGTNTVIALSDEVLLIDAPVSIGEDLICRKARAGGIRLDGYNMGNLFYGEPFPKES